MHTGAAAQKQKFPQRIPKKQEVANEGAEASFAPTESSEVSTPRHSIKLSSLVDCNPEWPSL